MVGYPPTQNFESVTFGNLHMYLLAGSKYESCAAKTTVKKIETGSAQPFYLFSVSVITFLFEPN